jgi:hypothetical protein
MKNLKKEKKNKKRLNTSKSNWFSKSKSQLSSVILVMFSGGSSQV